MAECPRQFVSLVVAPVPEVVGMLRHGHDGIWKGKARSGLKQKIGQCFGQVDFPVKFEL